jgi:hypothetical protein
MAEVIEAPRLPIALAGAIHERKVAWFAGCQEAPFNRSRERLRMSDTDETAHAYGSAILDQPGRLVD